MRILDKGPIEYLQFLILHAENLLRKRNILKLNLRLLHSFESLKKRVLYHINKGRESNMKKRNKLYLLTIILVLLLFTVFLCDWNRSTENYNFSSNFLNVDTLKFDSAGAVPYYQLTEIPKAVFRVEPVYPEKLREEGIEGLVVVKILIEETGLIEKTEIIKSAIPELNKSAIDAVKKFKFDPGKVDHTPVKVWVTVPFIFKLNNIENNKNVQLYLKTNGEVIVNGKQVPFQDLEVELHNLGINNKTLVFIYAESNVEMGFVNDVQKLLRKTNAVNLIYNGNIQL